MKTQQSPSRKALSASHAATPARGLVVAKPKSSRRKIGGTQSKPALAIPAILVEGDRPPPPLATGPGGKYAVGPTTQPVNRNIQGRDLPEAYGTGVLFLAARDPHTLYAHWDLTRQQLQTYNTLSVHRHLVVRIHTDDTAGPVQEVHVHPESRHWFLHVGQAETRYVAELGYYRASSQWVPVATSRLVATPPDTVCEDKSAHFATLPALMYQRSTEPQDGPPPMPAPGPDLAGWAAWGEAPPTLVAEGEAESPSPLTYSYSTEEWTPAREQALAALLGPIATQHDSPGSVANLDFVRPPLNAGASSPAQAFGLPSSPLGVAEKPPRQFWFNLNAELVLYGGTEPGATVTIAGRAIQIRPDGTFSCRFALPDGQYELTAAAISSDNEVRQAVLKFGRRTDYQGEVRVAPGEPLDKMPTKG